MTDEQQKFFIRAALVAALAFTVGTLGSVMGGTDSYAQGRACPEGFSLNRGICQAEPELTCENYNVAQERTNINDDGYCILTVYSTPSCPDPENKEHYSYFFHSCATGVNGVNVPTDTEPDCEWYRVNGGVDAVLTTERGYLDCRYYDNIGPAALECDVGELDEDSAMCETRPGNRNGNNRS